MLLSVCIRAFLLSILVLTEVTYAAVSGKCESFLTKMTTSMHAQTPRWQSKHLKAEYVTELSRAREIAEFTESGAGGQEVADYLSTLSRSQIEELRADIVESFNLFYDSYLGILRFTDHHIPESGTIGEFGCGAGIVCAYLMHDHPQRNIVAVDKNQIVLNMVGKRIKALGQNTGVLTTHLNEFAKINFESSSLDGAVISMTFFHLTYEEKQRLLLQLKTWLKPNAPIVMHDPVYGNYGAVDMIGDLDLGSTEKPRFTEFDLALRMAVNSGVFFSVLGPDYDHEPQAFDVHGLMGFVEAQGFVIEEAELNRGNGILSLVARNTNP